MSSGSNGGGEVKEEGPSGESIPSGLHERKLSRQRLRRYDTWDVEATAPSATPAHRSQFLSLSLSPSLSSKFERINILSLSLSSKFLSLSSKFQRINILSLSLPSCWGHRIR
ncbi:hypothetical protein ACLOJK_017942 [Asimina triloba]